VRAFEKFRAEHQGQAPPVARGTAKPFYTRERVAELYDDHRRGAYAGREKEWSQIENDIFAAQREGRIESVPAFLSK